MDIRCAPEPLCKAPYTPDAYANIYMLPEDLLEAAKDVMEWPEVLR